MQSHEMSHCACDIYPFRLSPILVSGASEAEILMFYLYRSLQILQNITVSFEDIWQHKTLLQSQYAKQMNKLPPNLFDLKGKAKCVLLVRRRPAATESGHVTGSPVDVPGKMNANIQKRKRKAELDISPPSQKVVKGRCI